MSDPTVLAWLEDKEFQDLPAQDQAGVIGNFFDREYRDAEFSRLPAVEQRRIRGNFLTDHLRPERRPRATQPEQLSAVESLPKAPAALETEPPGAVPEAAEGSGGLAGFAGRNLPESGGAGLGQAPARMLPRDPRRAPSNVSARATGAPGATVNLPGSVFHGQPRDAEYPEPTPEMRRIAERAGEKAATRAALPDERIGPESPVRPMGDYGPRQTDLVGGAEVFGRGLLTLPKQVLAKSLSMARGGGPSGGLDSLWDLEPGKGRPNPFKKSGGRKGENWADRIISQVDKDTAEFVEKYGKENVYLPGVNLSLRDLAELPEGLAFSLVSAAVGLTAGVGTGLATGGAGAVPVGATAAGAAAFRMAKDSIVAEYRRFLEGQKAARADMTGEKAEPLTPEEWSQAREGFESRAAEYGLWEALPEALGSGVGFKILTAPFKKALARVVGKDAAVQFMARMGGVYAEELATETVTQMGQHNIEATFTPGLFPRSFLSPKDWMESAREVAPGVLLLTATLGPVAYAGHKLHEKYAGRKDRSAALKQAAAEGRLDLIPDDAFDMVLNQARALGKELPKDEAVQSGLQELENEAARRKVPFDVKGEPPEADAQMGGAPAAGPATPGPATVEAGVEASAPEPAPGQATGQDPVRPAKSMGRQVEAKQPWQMTREEFEASGLVAIYPYETIVQRAHSRGEAVPASVLAQFAGTDWLGQAAPAAQGPAEQPPAAPAAKPNPLVGQYVRSGSVEAQVTAVRPDGKLVVEDGSTITPGAAPNYAVQPEPFGKAQGQAASEPPAGPEVAAQGMAEEKLPWQMMTEEWEKHAEGGKLHKATGKRLPGEDEAKTNIGQGEINGYPAQDIARFYLARRTYTDGTREPYMTKMAHAEYLADAIAEGKAVPQELRDALSVMRREVEEAQAKLAAEPARGEEGTVDIQAPAASREGAAPEASAAGVLQMEKDEKGYTKLGKVGAESTYYLAMKAGKPGEKATFRPVQGRAVKVPGLDGVEFFLHGSKAEGWSVSEARSGAVLVKGDPTQKRALITLAVGLEGREAELVNRVKEHAEQFGLSPRYAQGGDAQAAAPAEPAKKTGRKVLGGEEAARALGELFDYAQGNPKGAKHDVAYGLVGQEEAGRLAQAGLEDAQGMAHVVDSLSVRHMLKGHGDAETEAARGQAPVTREDIARIPEIVAAPDSVSYHPKQGNKPGVVRYAKRVNGNTFYVEEVRTGKRELAAKTLWKKAGAPRATPEGGGVAYTPEATPAEQPTQPIVTPGGEGKRDAARQKEADRVAKAAREEEAKRRDEETDRILPISGPGALPLKAIRKISKYFIFGRMPNDLEQSRINLNAKVKNLNDKDFKFFHDWWTKTPLYRELQDKVAAERAQAPAEQPPAKSDGKKAAEPPAESKQPWRMTVDEYRLAENRPLFDAVQEALASGQELMVNTQYKSITLSSPEHVRLTSRGEFQVPQGKKWVYLTQEHADRLARQAGVDVPGATERTYHMGEVEQAVAEGKPVPRAVLEQYKDQEWADQALAALDQAARPLAKSDGRKAAPAEAGASADGSRKLAEWVKGRIQKKEPFTFKELLAQAGRVFGGTIEDTGAFDSKAATDAMELGVNLYIQDYGLALNPAGKKSIKEAQEQIKALKSMAPLLPTQRVRSQEMDEFQQFSTPPHLAFTAAWALNIRPGETVLEPSAGTGSLAVFAQNAGAEVVANELSARRAGLLRELGLDRLFTENAEQLDNILPKDVRPTAVLMNPPFSSTAGRIQGQRKTRNATPHLEQALRRLAPGGRLVAIVGKGLGMDNPSFIGWWKKIQADYNVRADIRISGKEYVKYGTDFDNRILVIDKNGPTTTEVLRGQVEKVEDLVPLLEGIRNDRPIDAGRERTNPESPDQRPLPRPAQGGRRAGASDDAGRSGADAPGAREGAGQAAADRPGVGPGPDGGQGGQPAAPAGNAAAGLAGKRSGRKSGPAQPAPGAEPGGAGARPDPGGPGRDVPGRLTVTQGEASEPGSELTDSVYDTYRPAVKVAGAKPHPGKLAESAAMAAVRPAPVSYSPVLPASAISAGRISDAQLEAVVYAGHNHAQTLPDGTRRGFFIGDGTGVGKGREIATIMWDNWNQGRRKAVWISKNGPLFKDAARDIEGVGWDKSVLFDLGKVKAADILGRDEGVLFTTYDTLKGGEKKEGGQSRLDQIVNWLGKDFAGVIAFDESHKMANAMATKGKRGMTKPSQTALAAKDFREALPQARVVYVSATGATEPANLAYLDRLGLWGPETAFGDAKNFVNEVGAGGVAAMEMVAADMKALGLYLARNLSFDGVTYDRLEHPLTQDQRKAYNTYAQAWQGVLANLNEALELTGGDKNRDAKSAAYSAFWGANQRFWNQVLTSLQMPSVIKDMEAQIAAGRSVLLQLVNTNEALLNRRLAELEDAVELEDLDLTPTEIIGQFVENSFPVQAYEEYTDDDGNKRSRPVVDSAGNPVMDAQAVAMREALLDKLASVRGLDGPLDMVLAHFGADQVAEITGRSRRVVWVDDKAGRRKAVQKRSQRHADADAADYMDGRKRILVFSEAGGTGRSFHADKTAKNQQKRVHYLVQPGWRADVAIQGLGRSHRTNQADTPHYILCTTDVPAQARFVSTIARRLDQLGALTKGQRQTGSQGLFQAKDNLENDHAKDALRAFIADLRHGEIEGLDFKTFEDQTGLKLSEQTDDGRQGALRSEMPEITQVLNRTLSLDLDVMNTVFAEFGARLDEIVEAAAAAGSLDVGMETLRAKRVEEVRQEVVYTDERTGAQTVYRELALTDDVKYLEWGQVAKSRKLLQNKRSGRVWAVTSGLRTRTNTETGKNEGYYTAKGPASVQLLDEWSVDYAGDHDHQKFRELEPEEARALWEQEIAALPRESTKSVHLVTGTMLPVWDRLPKGYVRIVRAKTEAGDVLLGREIPEKHLDATLENLGVKGAEIAPEKALERIRDGVTARLANGWTLRQVVVQGSRRIELAGWSYENEKELDQLGVLRERMNWKMRAFIPQDKALEIITRLAKARPIVRVGKGEALASAAPDRRSIPPAASGPYLVDPVRRSAIMKLLDKALDVPIRIGGFRNVKAGVRKAEGVYKPGPGVARTRKANDVEVAAHEIAHHIQDKKLMPLPRAMPAEVQALAYEGAKSKDKEGFAEFVRLYVTQPEEARARAPEFHAWFDAELAEHPDLEDAISQARAMWEAWVAQPDWVKVMSLIRTGEKKSRSWTLNGLYRDLVDEFRPFQVLRREAEKRSGRKLEADEDAHLAAWLTRGWVGKAAHFIKHGTFQMDKAGGYRQTGPALGEILRPIHRAGLKNVLDAYLVAKRAAHDERIRKGFEGIMPDRVWGDVAREIEAAHPEVREAANKLHAYSDELLTYLVDAGRIAPEAAQAMRKGNLFYAPLYRVMEEDAGATPQTPSGKRFTGLFNPAKHLKGSARDIHSPVESIVRNTYALINVAERNRVGEALLKAAEIPGMGRFIEAKPINLKTEKVDVAGALGQLARWIKGAGGAFGGYEELLGELLGDVQAVGKLRKELAGLDDVAATAKLREAGFAPADLEALGRFFTAFRPDARRAGPNEAVFYRRGEPVLVEMDPDLAAAVKGLNAEAVSGVIKVLALPAGWLRAGAVLAPEFMLRNPIRDTFEAALNSDKGFIPFYHTLKGLFHVLKRDELYRKFYASGAAHGALVSLDRDYLSRDVERLTASRLGQVGRLARNPLELLRSISEAMEEATRVGEFELQLGGRTDMASMMRAGQKARDITLDFGRRGSRTLAMNLISAFWNASVQGADRMARAIAENPTRYLTRAFWGITVPSLLLWGAQKDDPKYRELPGWRRILFWNFVFHMSNGKTFVFSLPKPFSPGILFGSFPEMMAEWMDKEDPEGMKDAGRALLESLAPGVMPTALLLPTEWWAEKNFFFDRPTVPRGTEGLDPVLQFDERTSEAVKLLARGMHKVPVLRDFASPGKLANAYRGLTGGLGRLALDIVDKGLAAGGLVDAPEAPAGDWTDLPGLRGVVDRFPLESSRSVELFYRRYGEARQEFESAKQRAGVRGKGLEIARPARLEALEHTAAALSLLRRMARETHMDPRASAEAKREVLDKLYEAMSGEARAVLDRLDAAGKSGGKKPGEDGKGAVRENGKSDGRKP